MELAAICLDGFRIRFVHKWKKIIVVVKTILKFISFFYKSPGWIALYGVRIYLLLSYCYVTCSFNFVVQNSTCIFQKAGGKKEQRSLAQSLYEHYLLKKAPRYQITLLLATYSLILWPKEPRKCNLYSGL